MSDIILLYKKGNPLNINNYRPISLLGNVYKLFTSIIDKHITPAIDNLQPVAVIYKIYNIGLQNIFVILDLADWPHHNIEDL